MLENFENYLKNSKLDINQYVVVHVHQLFLNTTTQNIETYLFHNMYPYRPKD
jgi:hypothetical protein